MNAPSSARDVLAEKQRAFPPPRPAGTPDRVAALVDGLRASLPASVAALIGTDRLAVGELGEAHPDVATWPDGDRFVITFSTGMFDFVRMIVDALSTRFAGEDGAMAGGFDDVVAALKAALTTYRRQQNVLWSIVARPRFRPADAPLPAGLADIRRALIDHVGHFLLAHEFGHVAIDTKACPRVTDREEDDADRYGLEFSLRAALENADQGLALAAAGLAIRIYVSLQRFGVSFADAYPPMAERLATLNLVLLDLLGSQQRCDELSRVMVAMLDQMDDLDNHVEPGLPPIPLTTDRVRVGLIARLYRLAGGHMSGAQFGAAVERELMPYASLDVIAPALNAVCDYYWPWVGTKGAYIRDLAQRTTYTHDWLIVNSRALRDAVPGLPAALRERLSEPYRAAAAAPEATA
jgi:hypothetical protein